MPWAPLRICLSPGCRGRQPGAYCARHERLSPRNHRGLPRGQRGLGPGWERVKRAVNARDGGLCQLRLDGCTRIATTADHILPRSRGGGADPLNLRASCGHCNSARGDGSRDAALARRAAG